MTQRENHLPEGKIILYSEGEANINVRVEGETVWLTHGQGNVLALFFIGILLLPVMIPAWIAALVLNRYHAKQSETQS